MRLALLASVTLALLVAGCADGGNDAESDPTSAPTSAAPTTTSASAPTSPSPAPAPGNPTTHESVMRNNLFEPADLTIRVGDTVRWTTEDLQAHNVVSDSEAAQFRSPDVSIVPVLYAQEFSHTFTQTGVVDYVCEYHSGMVGTITVTP